MTFKSIKFMGTFTTRVILEDLRLISDTSREGHL